MEYQSDIPIEGIRKLNWTARNSFEEELKSVLRSLEDLIEGDGDRIDYINAYHMFVDRWSPRD